MGIKPLKIMERVLWLLLYVSTLVCQPLDPSTRRLHPSHPQLQSLPFSAAFPSCSAESPEFFIQDNCLAGFLEV